MYKLQLSNSSSAGSSDCELCSQGKYYQLGLCVNCPQGKGTDIYGAVGSESCSTCPIGKYGPGGTQCTPCDTLYRNIPIKLEVQV